MPWTRTSPLTGTCRAGLKVGGGGKGQEELGLACHVMARRRPGSLFTLKKKKRPIFSFTAQLRPTGLHRGNCAHKWVNIHVCKRAHKYKRIHMSSTMRLHHTCIHLHSFIVHPYRSTLRSTPSVGDTRDLCSTPIHSH